MEFPITSYCELWVRSVLPSHCPKMLDTTVENAAQQNVIGLWWVVGRSSTAILIKTGVKTICAIKLLKTCRNNDRKLPFYWVTLCVQSCLSLWLEYPKHRRWIEVSRLVFVGTIIKSILTSYVSSLNVRLVGISSLSSRSLHCLCKLSNAVENAVVGTGRSSLQAAVEFEMQCLSTLSKVEGFPSELWERRK